VWDLFAISAYLLVSLLFWYVGLIPDLATLRDRARGTLQRRVYGFFALGWRGDGRHWMRYETAYKLLAGLATPLVVSVHTVVALDFAVGNTPGFHSTLLPPYFVTGALFSGFAMVMTLAIPLRHWLGMQDIITARHLDLAARVMLATSLVLAYCYTAEVFSAFYSGDRNEIALVHHRFTGLYAPLYWGMLVCNIGLPQLFWFRRVRSNVLALLAVSLIANLGMWVERVLIVIGSLYRDFLPSAWGRFVPTAWDWMHLLGSISLFVLLFLLFVRLVPAISMVEMREDIRRREGKDAAP
jgi:molybdopterin-containing oxidoreductase family membrane subunit